MTNIKNSGRKAKTSMAYAGSTSNSDHYSSAPMTTKRPHGKEGEGLKKLMLDQLKDILWAETALTKAIPLMIKKASSEELINALNEHLKITKIQVEKVKEAFAKQGEKPIAKTCEVMKGLIQEAEELMAEMKDGNVLDAAIICAAQKIEHYEIATYGSLRNYAEILGEEELADLLGEILEEEKEADETLTEVAYEINWAAAQDEEDDEEEEEEEEDEEDEEEDEEEEEEDEEEDEEEEEEEEEEEDVDDEEEEDVDDEQDEEEED